jgi:hypothetical protein
MKNVEPGFWRRDSASLSDELSQKQPREVSFDISLVTSKLKDGVVQEQLLSIKSTDILDLTKFLRF